MKYKVVFEIYGERVTQYFNCIEDVKNYYRGVKELDPYAEMRFFNEEVRKSSL